MPLMTTDNEVLYGPMKLKQKTMSILLVFAKEDAQSDGFWWAADKMGYKCSIAHNTDDALECYLDKHHDLIIIDHRSNKNFDAETLCRSIRATKASEHTIIIAVMKRLPPEKDEPLFLPLLKAGFNKKFIENHNTNACVNELLALEYGEVRSMLKLKACSAAFSALDNVSDAVEISSEDFEIQYVNRAYERLTSYSSDEILGKDGTEFHKNERNRSDLHEAIHNQLKKGKYWEGTYYTRRKSGEIIPNHCHISPILGPGGKISHIVSVKNSTLDTSKLKDSEVSLANGGIIHGIPRRRESLAKIHSMTIEAPITKVIKIINAAQENSPITVVQALDNVLDILRTSELYSPYFAQQMKEDDPMTSDLVGGLVSQNVRRQLITNSHDVNSNMNSKAVVGHHLPTHIPTSPNNTLSHVPANVQAILSKEPSWEFNILSLEEATSKQPLVYLGLKTMARFGVSEFLHIEEVVLRNWLHLIESNYHSSNAYHNSTHAADVLHATGYFLTRERNQAILDHTDQVASLIAAAIHDVDHPGHTNAFLINERNPLAMLYNDHAVLENHHAALGFQLSWKDDNVNIFKNLKLQEYTRLRETIIDMVLATEMKQHFEHLNKFVNSINKTTLKSEETSSMSGNGSPDSMVILQQLSIPENRILIKRMLIKCADVCNPCRSVELCVEWAKRIAEEYFEQTDEEKRKGLPVVMPVFDRKTCSIPKSQTSFIDFFINDMFDAWDYYCDVPDLITHLQDNYNYWKEKEEEITKS